MKKIIGVLACLVLLSVSVTAFAEHNAYLLRDRFGAPIAAFVPDPAKSQVNSSMTGTLEFEKGATGDVDVTNWVALLVNPTADATYYFNSDTTKTYPLYADTGNAIMIGQLPLGESVTLVLGAATASIQGM